MITNEQAPMTDKECDELKALCEPVAKYIRQHYDPHTQVEIGATDMKVTRDAFYTSFETEPDY